MLISIIIPVGTEKSLELYQSILQSYEDEKDIELIWVSQNEFVNNWLVENGQTLIDHETKNRAQRMNLGIEKARGELILLNHPRSVLQQGAMEELRKAGFGKGNFWGGFTHEFLEDSKPLLEFTSWYSNKVRLQLRGIIYLDHCIFFRKSMLKGPTYVPEVDIFEDTEFSLKLLNYSWPVRLGFKSYTSAVRFKKNGALKQALLNQVVKIAYLLKLSPSTINKIYEHGLWLN